MRKPNKVGGGAKTNVNGLAFEGRTNLLDAFKADKNFEIVRSKVFYNNQLIGEYLEKHSFYKDFLEPNGISYRDINSKKYLPDSVFYNHKNKTVYIIEKKFQEQGGSVDEKIQTCGFKKHIFSKLITPMGLKIEYYYLLNDWFDQSQYNDVFDYIKEVGCKYFINFIPFDELGL
ncbi:hypothetical protein N9V35_00695 [bacterium]|nr:hypothetical protein [bacterium]